MPLALAIAITAVVGFLFTWAIAIPFCIDDPNPVRAGLRAALMAAAVVFVFGGTGWLLCAVWSAV